MNICASTHLYWLLVKEEKCNILFSHLTSADDLCKQQMKLHLQNIGTWVRFTPTLHELYAHLPQLIGNIT